MLIKMKWPGKLELLAGALFIAVSATPVQATAANHQTCAPIIEEAKAGVNYLYGNSKSEYGPSRLANEEVEKAYDLFEKGFDDEAKIHLDTALILYGDVRGTLTKVDNLFEENPNCADEFPPDYVGLLGYMKTLNDSDTELIEEMLELIGSKSI